jgi:hypothetical protein
LLKKTWIVICTDGEPEGDDIYKKAKRPTEKGQID